MTATNQLKTRRQASLHGAGANGCLTTAVLIVAPSYSIVLWFTQPPRRSINNSTGFAGVDRDAVQSVRRADQAARLVVIEHE